MFQSLPMTKRFLLLFSGYFIFGSASIMAIAFYFLYQAYFQFTGATSPELIPVMAEKMFLKALISFVILTVVYLAISMPLGISLVRLISRPYLSIFKNLSDIAQQRLRIEDNKLLNENEIAILNRYMGMLIADLQKLKDYEKEKEWKNGARMLMHELKNPLTPLKLSVQNLLVRDSAHEKAKGDITHILTAINDIEYVLSHFKELVNIDFGPKKPVDIPAFLAAFHEEMTDGGNAFPQRVKVADGCKIALSESHLLKILYRNLVFNGLEENEAGFHVEAHNRDREICIQFITPGSRVENPSRVFKLGYSTKGKQRGFGLFLCKKISDYLDYDLKCECPGDDVVFSLRLAAIQPAGTNGG